MKKEDRDSLAGWIHSKRSLYFKCRFKFYVNYTNTGLPSDLLSSLLKTLSKPSRYSN